MTDKPVRFILESCSEIELEKFCIEFLKTREWIVEKPGKWETPKEVAARLNVSPSHLSRTMKKGKCPRPADVSRGPTGRIVYIRSTIELDSYLIAYK